METIILQSANKIQQNQLDELKDFARKMNLEIVDLETLKHKNILKAAEEGIKSGRATKKEFDEFKKFLKNEG